MIYFEFKRTDGSLVVTTIVGVPEKGLFNGEEELNIKRNNARNLFTKTHHGSIRILVVDDEDYLNSTKMAKKLLDAYAQTFLSFILLEEETQARWADGLKLFAHNLIEVHTQLKDTVERIFNTEVQRAKGYKEQKGLVKNKIQKDVEKAADDICQIAKRLDDMDAQITGFRIISGIIKKSEPNLGKYNLKNVLLRHVQPFLSDLQDEGVGLEFESTEEEFEKNKISADPKMVNVALHHFFQNATKYICPDSDIQISINTNAGRVQLLIKMISMKIEPEELENIFERGVSGKNVGSLAGQGIGMFVIESALEHFGASINIKPDYSNTVSAGGKQYTINSFIFDFPTTK